VSEQDAVAKAMYDTAAAVSLTQLRGTPTGDTLEEDHQRDRQMIVNFIRDQVPGAIEQFDRGGNTYVQVADYQKMRQGVGLLLVELMRIKAEGDYPAIKALVEKYGVHFDPKLRDQVVARFRTLGDPTYWAGINAKLTARLAKDGQFQGVDFGYPRDVVEQYLTYAAMYDRGLLAPAKH